MENKKQIDEKILQAKSGWGMLILSVLGIAAGILLCVFSNTVGGQEWLKIVMVAI